MKNGKTDQKLLPMECLEKIEDFCVLVVDKNVQTDCVCSSGQCVKSNMVYSGVQTWYIIHSLVIFR